MADNGASNGRDNREDGNDGNHRARSRSRERSRRRSPSESGDRSSRSRSSERHQRRSQSSEKHERRSRSSERHERRSRSSERHERHSRKSRSPSDSGSNFLRNRSQSEEKIPVDSKTFIQALASPSSSAPVISPPVQGQMNPAQITLAAARNLGIPSDLPSQAAAHALSGLERGDYQANPQLLSQLMKTPMNENASQSSLPMGPGSVPGTMEGMGMGEKTARELFVGNTPPGTSAFVLLEFLNTVMKQADDKNSIDGIEEVDDEDDYDDAVESSVVSTHGNKGRRNASSFAAPSGAPRGGRRVSARSAGRGRVTYAEVGDFDGDGSEHAPLSIDENVEDTKTRRDTRGKRRATNFDDYDDEAGGDDDDDSEFQVNEDFEDEEDEEDEMGRGKGRRGGGPTNGRSRGKASTAVASSPKRRPSRSTSRGAAGAVSGASAGSRGKRRGAAAEGPQQPEVAAVQASSLAGVSRKRRLPAWASAASAGRDGDQDVEEISSAVSSWGEAH